MTVTIPNYISGYSWYGIVIFSTSSEMCNTIITTATNSIRFPVYGEGGNLLPGRNSWYYILWIGVKN